MHNSVSDSVSAHVATHDRKGREGKGREIANPSIVPTGGDRLALDASSADPSHRMDGQPCPRCNRLIRDGCSLCCCEHPEHAATWQGVECPACGTGVA